MKDNRTYEKRGFLKFIKSGNYHIENHIVYDYPNDNNDPMTFHWQIGNSILVREDSCIQDIQLSSSNIRTILKALGL